MADDFTDDTELLMIPDEQLEFPLWLQKKFIEAVQKNLGRGRVLKKREFAEMIGISDQNFSTYILGKRRPAVDQVDRMAEYLGPVIYDKLGLPRKMPKNRDLLFIVDHWAELDDRDHKEILEIIKNKRAAAQNKRGGSRGEVFAE